MLIDGELVEAASGGLYDNVNPTDGSVLGQACDADDSDVERAVVAARRAFDETSWAEDHEFRRRCLVQLQEGLWQTREELREIQVSEAGMTITTAMSSVDGVIENMSFMIDLVDSYAYERTYPVRQIRGVVQERRVRHEPYGVAGLITPWNAPFQVNIWKLTPALATGNVAVLKAAPATPFSAAAIARVVAEQTDIPAGVVNVLTAEDKARIGERLTGDPRVDMFHFTGSPGVGQRVMAQAAVGLRKVALELGGKSANIFLDDVDLDTAIPFATAMACTLSGQGCALPTRVLLPRTRYEDGVEALRAAFERLPIGDPHDPTTVIGPIISAPQRDRVLGLVEHGIGEGARLVTGGKPPKVDARFEGGFWVEPTLFVDVDPSSTIAQTEVFGPVLCVIAYETDDDAVRIANGTPYGLSGYVQSPDRERALAVARRMRTGTVGIGGTAPWMSPDIPFGGYGISGLGREHGVEGFEEYLQTKALSYPA
jgi:aldehyde dehydrogenase (NAD+)